MNGLMLLMDTNQAVKGICYDAAEILRLVGWVLTVFKIVIPLIIIALGLFDLGKAAVSNKPEDIKKTVTSLIWRLVGGIAIFFVPAIIMVIFGFVSGFNQARDNLSSWDICYGCIVSPWNDKCSNAAEAVSKDVKYADYNPSFNYANLK